jgi:hypothetical protein
VPQTVRSLPGIRFEREAPPLQEVLPRMDIAGFVGFAASGPIDVPVPIEDPAQFAQVFGDHAPLAWDAERGETVSAFLGPAVRAFFRNGGRRCWVVRVADRARAVSDSFQLPGIAAVEAARGTLAPAVLPARSEGSWADGLRVSTSVEPTPVRLQAHSLADLTFEALLASDDELVRGDLVRISFPRSPWTLYVGVAALDDASSASPPWPSPAGGADPQLRRRLVRGGSAYWVRPQTLAPERSGHLHYLGAHGTMHLASAKIAAADAGAAEGLARIAVDLTAESAEPPQPGALVRGVFSGRTSWLDIVDVDVTRDGTLALVAIPLHVTRSAPRRLPRQAADALAERLTLRLQVEDDAGGSTVLGGIGFLPAHPRFLGLLPTDASLYADASTPPAPGSLAADAARPRLALAGPAEPPPLYLPLGATILESPALPALRPPELARRRDGLERLDASLFLDPGLASVAADVLLEQAHWLAYRQPEPRSLSGVHSLLPIDEVTIVAVPEATQRSWYLAPGAPIAWPGAPTPPAEPDWASFLDCATHVPATPALTQTGDEETGAFTLVWGATDVADATYELQESTDPSDEAATDTLYEGPQTELAVYGRPRGSTLYYRVRALAGGLASGWSSWVVVRRTQTPRWLLDGADAYDATETLLPVQLALLRMCAARGDLFAALALPEHYRERAAISHVLALKGQGGSSPGARTDPIFSYGALYHPWLYASEPADPARVGRVPPDGAAAGVIAGRATRRGAWVAPANEPLRDVVQLDPPLGADWLQALQDAQVNVVRHDPAGFLCLAADTLSDDPDLRPIGVRRLLQVLRRAAALHGAVYAFEPNSDAFRRTVQRAFEQLLARMFELGAFAGATASDAYRVDAESANTPESIDAGRLIVELKVAPSRPLVFLTVRLVRTGEGSLLVETR